MKCALCHIREAEELYPETDFRVCAKCYRARQKSIERLKRAKLRERIYRRVHPIDFVDGGHE